MKARVSWFAGLLALSGTFPAIACAQELRVVATIKPLHALVAQVMAGAGTPRVIVEGAASPHTFSLKPSDAKAFNDAELLFRVSETVEPFTAKIVASLPKSVQVVSLDQTPGLTKLARRSGGMFEKHDHDRGAGKKHKEDASVDGHLWLDPGNARLMVDAIVSALSAKAPQHATKFSENGAAAKSRIDRLQAEMARDLTPLAERPFIVFHDAYQYLERAFGLSAVGSISVNPETPPSAKRLRDVREKIASLKAVCVFSEPNFETKVVQTVIEGTSAKSGVLDPEGVMTRAGPDHYDEMMRRLSDGLKGCLASLS